MDRWLRLALASFGSTMTIVMLGVVHRRVVNTEHVAVPSTMAQVAQATVTLSMASASTEVAVPGRRLVRDTGWPDALDPEPDLTLTAAPAQWSPPTWFPEETRDSLWTLDSMGPDGSMGQGEEPYHYRLRLRSRTVFAYDLDSGEVLLSRGADDRFPVASLTKVISALTLVSEHPDLDAEICIDQSLKPSWPGAVTRLKNGTCTTGWDLLGAALVRSDNAAAYAFAPIAGLPHYPFVSRINQVAQDLKMDMSTFSDPSGAEDDNLSTARDMTRAIYSASQHPVLAPVVSAPFWDIKDRTRGRVRRLLTTNRMHGNPRLEIIAGKTGYTDTARNCFSAVVRTRSGRKVAFTTMGAWRSRHRWSDVRKILDWIDRGVL